MEIKLRVAERSQTKLRIGLSGPSGSGKTYSSLLLARGIASAWEKIVLIDTENGSGEMYSNLGAYNVITLSPDFTPEKYIAAILAAEDAGMEVIVLDSVSHEWDGKGGCLEMNDKLANAKFKGNTWAAWSETTPRHQKFIQAITSSDCHIITTQRSKTDTIQTDDKKIKKVGLKDIQREGYEYELTANFNIDRDTHMAIASKDRTSKFIDRDPFVINHETGIEFMQWNKAGKTATAQTSNKEERLLQKKAKIVGRLKLLGYPIAKIEEITSAVKLVTTLDLTEVNYDEIINRLDVCVSEAKEAGTLGQAKVAAQDTAQAAQTTDVSK